VINGSFGANLAKFVTTEHQWLFGSTAFDRAKRSAMSRRIAANAARPELLRK